jgi:hypothetical protein
MRLVPHYFWIWCIMRHTAYRVEAMVVSQQVKLQALEVRACALGFLAGCWIAAGPLVAGIWLSDLRQLLSVIRKAQDAKQACVQVPGLYCLT